MMTYKKLAKINYDCFISVCVYLNNLVRELKEDPEYHDPYRLKKAKNALKTAIKYLNNDDYCMLDYRTNHNVAYYDHYNMYEDFLVEKGFFDR